MYNYELEYIFQLQNINLQNPIIGVVRTPIANFVEIDLK